MYVLCFFILVLNRITTTTSTSIKTSKQYETINKDFLFPDQLPTSLRKEEMILIFVQQHCPTT